MFKDSPFCVFSLTAQDSVSYETPKILFHQETIFEIFSSSYDESIYFRFTVLLSFPNETNESVTHETRFLK